jgi:hypothetical protein
VPGDPSLDGRQTTSLCGPEAERDFRAGVVDMSATALSGVLLATDGYGNAQVADPWAEAVSADLAQLISDRPPQWLAGQLPSWAGRCASADGSADDTTVALLLAPQTPAWPQAAPQTPASPEAAAETVDIPRVPAEPDGPAGTQTPPDGLIAATRDGRGPARRSRRLAVIGTAVVIMAAVAVFLAISLGSPAAPKPAPTTSCTSPSAVATASGTARAATGGTAQHATATAGARSPAPAAGASCPPGPGR